MPQIKPPYLQINAPEGSVQVIFLTPSGKLTALQRNASQAFPATYMPRVNWLLNRSEESALWKDDGRYYAIMNRPDKKKLREVSIFSYFQIYDRPKKRNKGSTRIGANSCQPRES